MESSTQPELEVIVWIAAAPRRPVHGKAFGTLKGRGNGPPCTLLCGVQLKKVISFLTGATSECTSKMSVRIESSLGPMVPRSSKWCQVFVAGIIFDSIIVAIRIVASTLMLATVCLAFCC